MISNPAASTDTSVSSEVSHTRVQPSRIFFTNEFENYSENILEIFHLFLAMLQTKYSCSKNLPILEKFDSSNSHLKSQFRHFIFLLWTWLASTENTRQKWSSSFSHPVYIASAVAHILYLFFRNKYTMIVTTLRLMFHMRSEHVSELLAKKLETGREAARRNRNGKTGPDDLLVPRGNTKIDRILPNLLMRPSRPFKMLSIIQRR